MSIANKIDCFKTVRNTGTGSCVVHIQKITFVLLVPKGWVIPDSALQSVAALRTYLEAAIIADKSIRIFPVSGFVNITDNSEGVVAQTFGYGQQVIIRDGNYNWTLQFHAGGLCLSNALRSFNNSDYEVIFGDDQNILFGTNVPDETGKRQIGGVPMDSLYALPWAVNTGAEVAKYQIALSFQPSYINEGISYAQVDFKLSDLMGLQNIVIAQIGTSLAGLITVQALSGCASTNLIPQYATELATEANWIAINGVTMLPIAITTATVNTLSKTIALQLDAADPNYPVTAGGPVIITMIDAIDLDAAGIEGYEALELTTTRG